MKKGIIFDLDGTLWDASVQITASWNEVLIRHRLEKISLSQLCSYLGKTPEEIAALMLPMLHGEQRSSVMNECFDAENRYLMKHGGNLYPDLEKNLKELSADYMLYIVSNCSFGYIETFLAHHKLNFYFSDFEHAGRTGLDKGSNIRLLMERNHLTSAVYVGDTQGDCDASRKAGISFIHAAYGFGAVSSSDAVINSFSELPKAVKQIL